MRTARAITAAAATLAVVGWTLTTGASYKLVSHFVHMRPVTAVTTARPEVGVLVDAPIRDLPLLAGALSARGIHVSFAIDRVLPPGEAAALSGGDQVVPKLPTGGLVRWMGTRGELRHLIREMGVRRHFLYASRGPCLGQWWLAHRAGGRLIAGAVNVDDPRDRLGPLRPGEVVELTVTRDGQLPVLVDELARRLQGEHLTAVPVGRLMRDAGVSV
jgi:hypothetical protein